MTNSQTQSALREAICGGLLFGGDCAVPTHVAVCPECGDTLHAENNSFEQESGLPMEDGFVVLCSSDLFCSTHDTDLPVWKPAIDCCIKHFCGPPDPEPS